jgi:hypothetical protein
MRRAYAILLPIIGVVALAGLVFGSLALFNQPTPSTATLQAEVRALRSELTNQKVQIAALKNDSQAGAVQTLQSSLRGLTLTMDGVQSNLKNWNVCLPEIQQELSGMTVQTQNNGVALTDAYLQNPTIISSDCTKTLNGNGTSNGP